MNLRLPTIALLLGVVVPSNAIQAALPDAECVVKATGISKGLAVVVGDEPAFAVELAKSGRFVVHLLVADAQRIPPIRAQMSKQQLGGLVVVHHLVDRSRLPHPDRFANLVVADLDVDKKLQSDLQRIMALRGAGYVKRDGQWAVSRPKANAALDGWYAHWYDATGNCVSADRVAGLPRAVQWQHGPAMEDGTADGKIPRIADGRIVFLDNQTGDLVCRDAGNGLLLWRRYIGSRHNSDLAIAGGHLHLWFDPNIKPSDRRNDREIGFLTAFDLRNSKIVQTFDQGLRAGTAKRVKAFWRGRLRDMDPVPWFVVTERAVVQAYGNDLVAMDRRSGKRLWAKSLDSATWFSPIVSGDIVLCADAAVPGVRGRNDNSSQVHAVSAFRLSDGKRLWRNDKVHSDRQIRDRTGKLVRARPNFMTMSTADEKVVVHTSSYQYRAGGGVTVLNLKDGSELWRQEYQPKQLYTQGSQRPVIRKGEVVVLDGTGVYRYDAKTGNPLGEPVKRPTGLKRTGRRNGACTASRATLDWLMVNGWLYVGPKGSPTVNQAARGACGQGVIPANGLVYVLPTACDCGDYVRGILALAPKHPGRLIANDQRRTRGVDAPDLPNTKSNWPIFLGNPQRTSFTTDRIDGELKLLWKTKATTLAEIAIEKDRKNSERFLGALSAPVVGDGLVVAAAPEAHEVIAVDAQTGTLRWRFPTGGKVDSPPTLAHGMAVFGCDDGAVYALRLSDGKLVWRFLAAPSDGLSMSHGHLASAYPIPGSVQVLQQTVIAVAGSHTDLGGLHVWALDLTTGKPKAQRILKDDRAPALTNNVTVADADGKGFWVVSPQGGSYGAGGAYHLSVDLKDLPMNEQTKPAMRFDRQGTRIRFRTESGRGGSTHGWRGAMRANAYPQMRGHRIAVSKSAGFALLDPNSRTQNAVSATEERGKGKAILWKLSAKDLAVESLGALIVAGDTTIVGGGKRDGSGGRIFLIGARDGKVRQTHSVPARVTECGMAVSGGRLFVCCEDGTVVCFGR